MRQWHFRHARTLIYTGTVVAVMGIAGSINWDSRHLGRSLIEARQLYGLWALGFVLASIVIGPLTSVLPWLPFKPSLVYGRRAVGVSATVFAVLHVAACRREFGQRPRRLSDSQVIR